MSRTATKKPQTTTVCLSCGAPLSARGSKAEGTETYHAHGLGSRCYGMLRKSGELDAELERIAEREAGRADARARQNSAELAGYLAGREARIAERAERNRRLELLAAGRL